jgi:microcystin-dependent protein
MIAGAYVNGFEFSNDGTNPIFAFKGTHSVKVPVGTTLQRPAGGAATAGQTRFNSTTGLLEFYDGANWIGLGGSSGGPPTGAILPYGGSSAPTGYLLCDGTAVDRTTYAALFTAIGTAYGAGDGSTTFNLPDLRERFPKGKNADALGATGGSMTHTHGGTANSGTGISVNAAVTGITTQNAVTNVTAQANVPPVMADAGPNMVGAAGAAPCAVTDPGHAHGINDPTHPHGITDGGHSHGISADGTPPYQTVNYIIKT